MQADGRRRCPMGDDLTVPGAPIRTFHHGDADAIALTRAKRGRQVSVCIPARNEASTVASVVRAAHCLMVEGGGPGLVDEVLVVDDRSTDTTGAVAAAAGARVVTVPGQVPGHRRGTSPGAGPAGGATGGATGDGGKGQAMRVALDHAEGDLVVFLDADVENAGPHFVCGLLLPLLAHEDIALVKGCYERPLRGQPGEGGRVTELVARPVLSLLFPEVAGVLQPLAGETAAPRAVLDKVELADGYGVEIGLLLDVAERFGTAALAQVDLGIRVHRNRPLAALRTQAVEVLQTALARAGALPSATAPQPPAGADRPPVER